MTAIRADYARAMATKTGNHDFDWSAGRFADALEGAVCRRNRPDIDFLLEHGCNGLNKTILKVFSDHTGVKLPRSQYGQRAAIAAWASP